MLMPISSAICFTEISVLLKLSFTTFMMRSINFSSGLCRVGLSTLFPISCVPLKLFFKANLFCMRLNIVLRSILRLKGLVM